MRPRTPPAALRSSDTSSAKRAAGQRPVRQEPLAPAGRQVERAPHAFEQPARTQHRRSATAGAAARNRASARVATRRRSSSDSSAARVPDLPEPARRRSAMCSSVVASARQIRSVRSSVSSLRRSVSVSSATSKAGIEVGLERKLAQERQAERVDRADRDVAEPVARAAASVRRPPGIRTRPASAPRTMRSRISAAALRVNVIARMFDGSTPARTRFRYRDTSTRGLPGAGRGLEHDVARRIHREGARLGIRGQG